MQAYAITKVLSNLGFEAEIIEKKMLHKPPCMIVKMFLYPWRWFLKKALKKRITIRSEEQRYNWVKAQYDVAVYTLPFIKKYIPHRNVQTFSEIEDGEYHAFVVGSDQIWRPIFVKEVGIELEDAFLAFTRNWEVKRIGYAASFGVENWEYTIEETSRCRELISRFDAVACREESGTIFCKKHLNFPKAITVLDPTLLLQKQYYLDLLDGWSKKSEGNLMCYILDEDDCKTSVIQYVASSIGLTPFRANAKRKFYEKASIEERLQPPVEKWIAGFRDANFIITDSFHGCVFSIIFRKPFIVIANHDRGIARFKTLLSTFKCEDRMVSVYDEELLKVLINKPFEIDQNAYEKLQSNSIEFLKSNLQ